MRLDSLYITHWSLRDPLTESQVLPVLFGLGARGFTMGLVTFEQDRHALDPEQRRRAARELRARGIAWHPLRYHKRPRVLATLWDALAGSSLAVRLCASSGVGLVHSRGTVAAAPAALAALLTRSRFLYDADGQLSEEYVDAGVWARGSTPHRLTSLCERVFPHLADAVAALTRSRSADLREVVGREVTVLPCGVDTTLFRFDGNARARVRENLGLEGTTLVYAGKWGGWYATEEMFAFAARAREVLGSVTFLVLTPGSTEPFEAAARRHDPRGRLVIRRATRDEMPGYLSAADVGLSFRRPSASARSCSPVKNGEYLACGLPIVTPEGIGDYSELANRRRVGVALPSLTDEAFRSGAASLAALLAESGLRERCRTAAVEEVGFEEVVLPRYLALYERLLGRSP